MLIKIFVVALILGLICAGVPAGGSGLVTAQTRPKTQRKVKHYACPMHPDVTSTKTGKCPKCGMSLRVVADKVEAAAPAPSAPMAKDASDPSSFSSSRIPDVKVFDQNGKRLSFYSDLVKGKTVAINFIFTTCTAICPPLTATFRRVQQDLGERDRNVQLISISVDPATDTPERLHDFAAKFKAEPGWTFVTGDRAEIDSLLRALGASVANKNDHTPMILIANDATGYWTRIYGLSPSATLVKAIAEAASHK
jgi:cytochrome oxidase Cu insertion factor (SCO1/SenC/PrrC family)